MTFTTEPRRIPLVAVPLWYTSSFTHSPRLAATLRLELVLHAAQADGGDDLHHAGDQRPGTDEVEQPEPGSCSIPSASSRC